MLIVGAHGRLRPGAPARLPHAADAGCAEARRRRARAARGAGEPGKEVIENPVRSRGPLEAAATSSPRGTLIILIIMSMGSWYIMFVKVYEQMKLFKPGARKCRRSSGRPARSRKASTTLKDGSRLPLHRRERHQGDDAPRGQARSSRSTSTPGSRCRSSAPWTTSPRASQDGLAFLATVGSTAPFVGLFGTVWGIYHALTAIGIAGQASIDKVAGPVGEALIMTAIGLAVAVPAVLGYNWLVRRNKVAMEQLRALRRRPAHGAHERQRDAPRAPGGSGAVIAMAMTVGQDAEDEQEVMAAINTTPLVDVMLVLLIIFLITIPVVIQQIPVELPKERNHADADQAREHRHRGEQGRRRVLEHGVHARLEGALREAEDGRGARCRSPRSTSAPTRKRATSPWAGVVARASAPAILKIGFITEPPRARGG